MFLRGLEYRVTGTPVPGALQGRGSGEQRQTQAAGNPGGAQRGHYPLLKEP